MKIVNKKHLRFLMATGALIITLVYLLFFLHTTPSNIKLVLNFKDSIQEGQKIGLHLDEPKDYVQKDYTSTIKNGRAIFSIDPAVYDFNGLTISFDNGTYKLSGIDIYTGFDNDRLRKIDGLKIKSDLFVNKSLNIHKNVLKIGSKDSTINASLSKNAVKKIRTSFNNDKRINGILGGIVTLIYLLFLSKIYIFKRISTGKYLLIISLVSIYVLFFVSFYLSNGVLRVSSDLASNTDQINETVSVKNKLTSTFKVNVKNFDGVEFYGNLVESDELKDNDEILMAQVFSDSNKLIKTEIITVKEAKQQTVFQIEFSPLPKSKGKTYRIVISPLGKSEAFLIKVGKTSNDSISKMVIDGNKTDRNLLITAKYNIFPHREVILILAGIFLLVLSVSLISHVNGKGAKFVISLIYLFALLFFSFKVFYYQEFVQRTPDELVHISYVGYLEEHPNKIIPDFKEMNRGIIYEDSVLDFSADTRLNYLGHPPLYYKILQLSGGVTKSNGKLIVHKSRMQRITFFIGILSIILLFYLGYSRIQKLPLLHFLYAIGLTSIPMLSYTVSGISNDNLALLTCSIFLIGIVRFAEQKRDYLTYFLIVGSIVATVLTKVTAGMILIIAGLMVLSFAIYKERGFKSVINKKFLVFAPLLLLPTLYFVVLHYKFGTFQPSYQNLRFNEFVNSNFYVKNSDRVYMSLIEYVNYYWRNFFLTYTGIVSFVSLVKTDSWLSLNQLCFILFLLFPFLIKYRQSDTQYRNTVFMLKSFFFSTVFVCVLQFLNAMNRFYQDGYRGSYQSRYYLCIIAIFIFGTAKFFEGILSKRSNTIFDGKEIDFSIKEVIFEDRFIAYLSLIFLTWCVYYYDFIYFLMNFRSYIS